MVHVRTGRRHGLAQLVGTAGVILPLSEGGKVGAVYVIQSFYILVPIALSAIWLGARLDGCKSAAIALSVVSLALFAPAA